MTNYKWNLTHLYASLNDDQLLADIDSCFAALDDFLQWCDTAFKTASNPTETIVEYFNRQNNTYGLTAKIIAYPELLSSVDTANTEAEALASQIYSRLANYYPISVKFSNFITQLEERDLVFQQLPDSYRSLCEDIVENSNEDFLKTRKSSLPLYAVPEVKHGNHSTAS